MQLDRRGFCFASLGLFGAALSRPAWAQSADSYPGSRPVTLVVAWAPGGSTDFVARVLAQQLSKELNGNVVVDNRPGASGTIGHASVARARPDGYTLLLGVNSTYAMARHLFPQRGYDDDKAFVSTGRLAVSPIVLCVNPQLGVKDIAGFIAKAKAQPGKLSYASSGAGSSAHLATELFLRSAGIDVQNVTYRGGAPAVQALITGEVEMAFVDAPTALPLMADMKIIPLGVSTAERNPQAPDVPTIAESGFPGYDVVSWQGLLAPAGTAPAVIARLNAEANRALALPEVARWLAAQGFEPVGGAPAVLAALLRADLARWPALVQAAGARVD
jgi:tripartite-type tricarboxylate transporter receptor subunit TctC